MELEEVDVCATCSIELGLPCGDAASSTHVDTGAQRLLADYVTRFGDSLTSRDPMAVLSTFADCIRGFMGDAAVLVEIDDPNGTPLLVTRGMNEELVSGLMAANPEDILPGAYSEPLHVRDIATHRPLEGTLLLDTLERSGYRSMLAVPARVPTGPSRGVIRVLLRQSAELDDRHQRGITLFAQRMMLALEHIWLMQSAENSAARLQSIVESAYDAIITLGPGCLVETANRATLRLFGYAERELRGKSLDILFCTPIREGKTINPRALVDRFRLGLVHEVECRRRDGSIAYVDLTLSEIDGSRGYTAILRDVTARKSAEARLRDSDRLAVIGTLAAGLGHDMNNVLLPVRAHLNAIASTGRMTGAERADHVERIRASVSYLQHLADSLHGLALDPDGDGDGDGLGTTDIAEWWESSGSLLSKSLHRSVMLECAIDTGIRRVNVAPHALTRAVLNLFVNASEAMPRDRSGHWPKVVLRARPLTSVLHLEVSDNGAGMTPEVLRRAFDMFFTTKVRGLGTGLGLPLVRRVVERAGGAVELDSRPGLGTTVRLVLPYSEEESPAERLLATVKMQDGRAASVLTGFLFACGVEIDSSVAMLDADIAVVEAARIVSDDIDRWIAAHPAQRLVVVGTPAASVQQSIERHGVTLITDTKDLAALERGLEIATATID